MKINRQWRAFVFNSVVVSCDAHRRTTAEDIQTDMDNDPYLLLHPKRREKGAIFSCYETQASFLGLLLNFFPMFKERPQVLFALSAGEGIRPQLAVS